MDVKEIIMVKIAKLRDTKNWTQQELAEQIGEVQRTISFWERGRSMPDPDQLLKLANVFDVPVEWFYSENDLIPKKDDISLLIEDLLKSGKIKKPEDVTPQVMEVIELTLKKCLLNKRLEQLDK